LKGHIIANRYAAARRPSKALFSLLPTRDY
jgi:hypothetical protein